MRVAVSMKLRFNTFDTNGKLRDARRLHSITFTSFLRARYWILNGPETVAYTPLRAHETDSYLVCRLLLEKKKQQKTNSDACVYLKNKKQYNYTLQI